MGGGSKTTNVQQPATMSPEVTQLLQATVPQQTAFLSGNPLTSFGSPNPQQVAGLVPGQPEEIQRLVAMALEQPLLRPEEQQALAYAKAQAGTAGGGDIGNAPATVAAREAINTEFQNFTLPTMQSQLNLAGLGRSGALGDALAKASAGNAAALVPFLTNEANLQQQAGLDYVRALSGAGATEEQRATARPQTAFSAQEAVRGQQQQGLDAAFQDFLRRQNLTENVTRAGNSWIPASFGRTTKADTAGGGLLGALFGGSAK